MSDLFCCCSCSVFHFPSEERIKDYLSNHGVLTHPELKEIAEKIRPIVAEFFAEKNYSKAEVNNRIAEMGVRVKALKWPSNYSWKAVSLGLSQDLMVLLDETHETDSDGEDSSAEADIFESPPDPLCTVL